MFILEPAQVKPCSVNVEGKLETGIRVYGKAFRLLASYPPAQVGAAISRCRVCLDNHALSIIIKKPHEYTVWLQSPERIGATIKSA